VEAGGRRSYKMSMTLLGIPVAGLRAPYLTASKSELARFREGLFKLDVAEVQDLAAAAG